MKRHALVMVCVFQDVPVVEAHVLEVVMWHVQERVTLAALEVVRLLVCMNVIRHVTQRAINCVQEIVRERVV